MQVYSIGTAFGGVEKASDRKNYSCHHAHTVEPLLNGPLLSRQPLFGGQRPKIVKICQLYTLLKTSIQRRASPIISG